ncbi:MAG: DUF5684 domain-containing protein [Patescibacteria group bacterium]
MDNTNNGELLAVLLANIVVFTLAWAISSFLLSLVFKKAGIPMWKAWVPVYSLWIFLELGGQKGWISLLAVIPILNILTIWVALVFAVIAAYQIGLNFGKEGWFVLLYLFVPIAWYIWLAVDKTAVWQPGQTLAAGPSAPTGLSNQTPPTTPQSPSQPTTF